MVFNKTYTEIFFLQHMRKYLNKNYLGLIDKTPNKWRNGEVRHLLQNVN